MTHDFPADFPAVPKPIDWLKPHPRNYRQHPEDQLLHLVESIRLHGWYRPVVAARDGTILAGHGIQLAGLRMGATEIPTIVLDLDPNEPRALKILTGDNRIPGLGEDDDRLLTELLKELKADPEGLLGTGFDDAMLAGLVMVTRPASEISSMNRAAEWVGAGMPEYEAGTPQIKLIITFQSTEDRHEFLTKFGIMVDKKVALVWSTRWPWTDREKNADTKFDDHATA